MAISLSNRTNQKIFKKLLAWTPAAAIVAAGFTMVGISVATVTYPPLVELSPVPLSMSAVKTKANMVLALSVEFPTVGQAYRGNYDPSKTYIGYFDHNVCYKHMPASGGNGPYFDYQGPATNRTCNGAGMSGNFMNWAATSAIDIMRFGMTGGNRVVDEGTGSGKTIVERAWLPDNFYNKYLNFEAKFINQADIAGAIPTSDASQMTNGMYIYNCRDRVYFSKIYDSGWSTCTNPFNVSDGQSTNLVGPDNYDPATNKNIGKYYSARNVICDNASASNRLMQYDPNTLRSKGLCQFYNDSTANGGAGYYKPVGQIQVNADDLRIGVFGYLKDELPTTYGGVLRAPLKYVGPNAYDNNYNKISGSNPGVEWNVNTGVFIDNPQASDANYPSQGYPRSGVIMYLNKFGTLAFTGWNPNNSTTYKLYDPVSELYYEAIRYMQGKQPTSNAVSAVSGANSNSAKKENFPVYSTWIDPYSGFTDSTGTTPSCLRANVLTIADANAQNDRSVPGNQIESTVVYNSDGTVKQTLDKYDFIRAAETNPNLDVPFWTSVIGSYESRLSGGVSYTDSTGASRSANNISVNSSNLIPNLASASTLDQQQLMVSGGFPSQAYNASYYIAGLAYWANTQSFRTDLTKARITTYIMDVNEGGSGDTPRRQLYLAAKYGGFSDVQAGNSGNPYAPGTNVLWMGSDGNPKNYFPVDNPQKFIDSIGQVFSQIVQEAGTIAGGAATSQQLTNAAAASIFEARFNPLMNYWSGKVLKYPFTVNSDGSAVTLGSTADWEAGASLTTRTKADNGANRNIFIGSPVDRSANPSIFKWSDLTSTFKTAFNTIPYPTTSTLVDTKGEDRVNYLRGNQTKEISATNPNNPFRTRDSVLGDIVNSGLVYMGAPSTAVVGSGYSTFFNTNKNRDAVVFVNANDGMLHAFKVSDGSEVFAYIPGFLATKLNLLSSPAYKHISLADATPGIGEAYFDSKWHSILVSGVGGGAQGIYALDVTDPSAFDASQSSALNNILWEFTDKDSRELGNVLGTPQIIKIRKTDKTATGAATYGYYAVVASGVNNYASDGSVSSTGNPSIFIIDLSKKPTTANPWVEGTDFWRIELPQTSTSIASGLLNLTLVKDFQTDELTKIYAGDLQGNMWALDFTDRDGALASGTKVNNGLTSLGTDGIANLKTLNAVKTNDTKPLFVAKSPDGTKLQPISSAPIVSNSTIPRINQISFGTGKFLESSDLDATSHVPASFYSVLDMNSDAPNSDKAVTGRSQLQAGTISSGTITVDSFTWGYSTSKPSIKAGWYVNFNNDVAERQVSDITNEDGLTVFGTLAPPTGPCGDSGGNVYVLDAVAGNGKSYASTVGILGKPLFMDLPATVSNRDAKGQRKGTPKFSIIIQGSKGTALVKDSDGKTVLNGPTAITSAYGRRSWRQIFNYQENK